MSHAYYGSRYRGSTVVFRSAAFTTSLLRHCQPAVWFQFLHLPVLINTGRCMCAALMQRACSFLGRLWRYCQAWTEVRSRSQDRFACMPYFCNDKRANQKAWVQPPWSASKYMYPDLTRQVCGAAALVAAAMSRTAATDAMVQSSGSWAGECIAAMRCRDLKHT